MHRWGTSYNPVKLPVPHVRSSDAARSYNVERRPHCSSSTREAIYNAIQNSPPLWLSYPLPYNCTAGRPTAERPTTP